MRTSALDNPTLEADIRLLEDAGYRVDVLEQPPEIGVLVRDVPLREGWNRSEVDLLLRTTTLYPASEMDMFWVEPDLRLTGDVMPQAGTPESHFGQDWLRFSWHRNAPWDPSRDSLLSHFEFCIARLARIE